MERTLVYSYENWNKKADQCLVWLQLGACVSGDSNILLCCECPWITAKAFCCLGLQINFYEQAKWQIWNLQVMRIECVLVSISTKKIILWVLFCTSIRKHIMSVCLSFCHVNCHRCSFPRSVVLKQGDFSSQGDLAMSVDSYQRLAGRARNAAKYRIRHKTASTTQRSRPKCWKMMILKFYHSCFID